MGVEWGSSSLPPVHGYASEHVPYGSATTAHDAIYTGYVQATALYDTFIISTLFGARDCLTWVTPSYHVWGFRH